MQQALLLRLRDQALRGELWAEKLLRKVVAALPERGSEHEELDMRKVRAQFWGKLDPVIHGYDVKDRKLVVNEAEAQTVRKIFQLYLDLGCARRVKEAADGQGLISKYRRFDSGKTLGGVSFTRGRIYHLLANPVYVGEIRHKERSYPGQHPAIIERATFEAANLRLQANASRVKAQTSAASHSPLIGKLTDEAGQRLTPSHAVKRGKCYCYYVSRRLVPRAESLIIPAGACRLQRWRAPSPD